MATTKCDICDKTYSGIRASQALGRHRSMVHGLQGGRVHTPASKKPNRTLTERVQIPGGDGFTLREVTPGKQSLQDLLRDMAYALVDFRLGLRPTTQEDRHALLQIRNEISSLLDQTKEAESALPAFPAPEKGAQAI